jgi:hypothetical protein
MARSEKPRDGAPRPAPESPEGLAAAWFSGQDLVDAASALRTLADPGKEPPVRVWKACLQLSKGRLKDLFHYVHQAKLDFRDVLYWAESHER